MSALKMTREGGVALLEMAEPQTRNALSDALRGALRGERVRRIVHLAAQPGVRHSLENPQAYVSANVAGHVNVLEWARQADGLEGMVYASSSSVSLTAAVA